jgi:hypothetical protein
VNVALEVAQASATVTVTEEAPLVQAGNGDVSATMNQKQISEVPNPGNDLTYIVQTAPGVLMNTDMQGFANSSILGMPGTSNRFTVNGMSDNDNGANLPLVGSLNLLLGENQIQEATVVSIGYSGQFGGTAGANINYITKSGGNEFHGNAQYYWNGRVFNANDWFNNALQQPRPFDISNQWAASVGGPIKNDKWFFFLDTEGLRVLMPLGSAGPVPSAEFEAATITNIDSDARFGPASATEMFYKRIFRLYDAAIGSRSAIPKSPDDPLGLGCGEFTRLASGEPCAVLLFNNRSLPSQDALTSARVDWNASRTDRAFLQVQHDRGYVPIWTDPISPLFDADGNFRWWQGQLITTHAFGSSAASQFLLAATYLSPIFALVNRSEALAAFPATLNFDASGTFVGLAGINSGLAFPAGRPTTQYQISEDLVKIRGNQKFGFGVNFERIYWTLMAYTPNAAGVLAPQTLDAFYQGGVDPASQDSDFTTLTQSFASQASQRIAFYNLALYGQDEWHVHPNLTFTIALRAEHQSNPVCTSRCFARLTGPFDSVSHDPGEPYKKAIQTNQKQALAGTDTILWSPRFSFAWQPIGVSHNIVIRGGIGIFHDPVPGNLAWILSSSPPLLNSYTIVGGTLSPDEKNSLFQDARDSNKEFTDAFNAGETLGDIQKVNPNFFPPAITVPDARTRSPQYQRWSLDLEQAFGASTSFSIGYTGHHGIHQLVLNPSANAFGFGSLPAGKCTSLPVPPCADPRFSEVTQITSNAVSNYNGMVVSFRHWFSHWTNGLFQTNYTYGHAFDEVSNGGLFAFTFGSASSPQDPNNLRGAHGPAEYDVRHSFNASYVWEVPMKAALGGRGPDSLVKGWQISGTIFGRSGFPYTVFDFLKSGNLAQNNYFGSLYAVPIGHLASAASCGEGAAFTSVTKPCQPPQVLANADGTTTPNPNAYFVQSRCETGFNIGTLPAALGPCNGSTVTSAQGRNRFRGPNYFNTDFTIMKNTKLPGWDGGVLGIGFQFFNLFNHPNFGLPTHNISDSIFGQVAAMEQPATSILGAARGGLVTMRMIQLKVQLQF